MFVIPGQQLPRHRYSTRISLSLNHPLPTACHFSGREVLSLSWGHQAEIISKMMWETLTIETSESRKSHIFGTFLVNSLSLAFRSKNTIYHQKKQVISEIEPVRQSCSHRRHFLLCSSAWRTQAWLRRKSFPALISYFVHQAIPRLRCTVSNLTIVLKTWPPALV